MAQLFKIPKSPLTNNYQGARNNKMNFCHKNKTNYGFRFDLLKNNLVGTQT